MFLGAEQICVVFSQVFFLARADLGAHDKARAELDGLRVDEAGLGCIFMIDLVIMNGCCGLDGLLAMLGDSLVLLGGWWGLHGLRDGGSPVVCCLWLIRTATELGVSHVCHFRLHSCLLVDCLIKEIVLS